MSRIRYMKPYTSDKATFSEESDLAIIKTTIIKEARLKDSTVTIPIKPSIHPAGQRELASLNSLPALKIAHYLPTLLIAKEQKNIVTISQRDLAKEVGISLKSVTNGINLLLEYSFISKIGKQDYYISPKLAWFGYQVDWAIALKGLKTKGLLSKEYYSRDEEIPTIVEITNQ